jgi:hypothetical protein
MLNYVLLCTHNSNPVLNAWHNYSVRITKLISLYFSVLLQKEVNSIILLIFSGCVIVR